MGDPHARAIMWPLSIPRSLCEAKVPLALRLTIGLHRRDDDRMQRQDRRVEALRKTGLPMGDNELLASKIICADCVGEPYLKSKIEASGCVASCSYCGNTGSATQMGLLADDIDTAYDQHFIQSEEELDDNVGYGSPFIDSVEENAQIPRNAAEDLQELLSDRHYDHGLATQGQITPFDAGSLYTEKAWDTDRWWKLWTEFERILKTESRSFSAKAQQILESIFGGIEAFNSSSVSVVVDAGPGTAIPFLYRARAFHHDSKLKAALARPDKYLGSPTSSAAAGGRMNARGVSVFYGSDNPQVALAEVRPPVGARVAIAKFEILRPLRLLDLRALGEMDHPGSLFDPGFLGRGERAYFLKSLSHRITMPVMPDDEMLEYVPTQAIADFLAARTPAIDGIIFRSVQSPGPSINIVLFNKASSVADMKLPGSVSIEVEFPGYDGEDLDDRYRVTDNLPSPKDAMNTIYQIRDRDGVLEYLYNFPEPDDPREITLRVDIGSIVVADIDAVHFTSTEHAVRRTSVAQLDTEPF
jgi:hypothetical protein